MNGHERILTWLLRLGGVVMLTALGAVIMPFDWMNTIHHRVGLGELPQAPIVGYLARSISALYALHGALLIFLARDLGRYLPVIWFLAMAGGVFGLLMLVLDLAVGMPVPWTIGEGPFIVLLSLVFLYLIRQIKAPRQ